MHSEPASVIISSKSFGPPETRNYLGLFTRSYRKNQIIRVEEYKSNKSLIKTRLCSETFQERIYYPYTFETCHLGNSLGMLLDRHKL